MREISTKKQVAGRLGRGLLKTIASPLFDPIDTFKNGFSSIPSALTGLISIPERFWDTLGDIYYAGFDWKIDGEQSAGIISNSVINGGMTYWMIDTAVSATQVSSLNELGTPGYMAAAGYVGANVLVSGYRLLDRWSTIRPIPLPKYGAGSESNE